MKIYVLVLLACSLLALHTTAFAQDQAVNINIGSTGAGSIGTTIASVRQLVGHAVGSGVVDKFIVFVPREGGPIPIEGGLTACAEAGFGIDTQFTSLVAQLRSIQPSPGIFLNLEAAQSCDRKAQN